MADLSETIKTAAEGPAEASGDQGSAKQHNLKDLIEVDRYLASKNAAKNNKRLGLRMMKISPPGSV